MKKILSILAMVLCAIASLFVIGLASMLLISLIEFIYYKSRALFWVILLCGGSFGLWVFWAIIPMAAALTVSLSQKVSLSKKGLRYTVMGIVIIVIYGISLIGKIANPSQYSLIDAVFSYILFVFYSIALIVHGRETAQLEYVPSIETNSQQREQKSQAIEIAPINEERDIPTDSLKALKELHDEGVISEEEFSEKKRKLLKL